MPRNLRKGKRRNYKKLDEGVEILDELLPADHETEEEQENDLSPKESDVNDDNRVSDGDNSGWSVISRMHEPTGLGRRRNSERCRKNWMKLRNESHYIIKKVHKNDRYLHRIPKFPSS